MSELFYKIMFGILWLIYILVRVPHDKKYKQNRKESITRENAEKGLVLINFFGLVLIPIIWMFSPWFNSFNLYLPQWLRIIGILLIVISLFFFYWVHKTLGQNWSPVLEIRKDHQLVKSGPYKNIRHPMYSQIWLWVIAQFLVTSNLISGLSGFVAWTIVYFSRVKNEESMMLGKFGDSYKEYMSKTGRVLPKINSGYKV